MEDEACDRQHHIFYGNIYWSFSVYVSFSLHFYNTFTNDLCVPTLFRPGSSITSHVSSVGHVYRPLLRICHMFLHSRFESILIAMWQRICILTPMSITV